MLTFELAAVLLLAIVRLFYIWLGDQRLASTADMFSMYRLHSVVMEATGRHLVGTQTEFRLQLLLHIFHACLGAIVLMIAAVVVEDVPAKV